MGYARFILCMFVIHGHFVPFNYHWHHQLSVYGFFLISGFLITLTVNEVYSADKKGILYFLANRFIRIYPTYWACLIITLLIGKLYPQTTLSNNGIFFSLPKDTAEWIPRMTILGISNFSLEKPPIVLLAQAWSLSTEVFFYIIIGIFTGRNKSLTLGCLFFSCGILIGMMFQNAQFNHYYFTIHGAAIIFFFGSLCYHYRSTLQNILSGGLLIQLLTLTLILGTPYLLGFNKIIPHSGMPIFLYFGTIIVSLVVSRIYYLEKNKKITKIEQFLADVSYPLFLLHWPIGALVSAILHINRSYDYGLFLYGVPISFIAATFVVILVEQPLKKARSYLRIKAQK